MSSQIVGRDEHVPPMSTILALETSCDETAVAVLRGRKLLASEVASQIAAHEKYGGVVPEIASRNHLIEAPRLLERAARIAGIDLADVDAFAATSGPGLASSLMIGASIAKGLALGFGKPYLAVNHLEGHLLSPFFPDDELKPNISLIVSGGHTMSVHFRGLGDYRIVGETVDDAAGEAFDKVAKMLGLGYPGGPEIEKHARQGNSRRFNFPRSMPDSENFSFSGLKTAVRYLLAQVAAPASMDAGTNQKSSVTFERQLLADLCASFQQAVVDVLVGKTVAAAKKCAVPLVTVSGGVSCNQELIRQLGERCLQKGLQFMSAEKWLSTDNAAMIAFAASLRLARGDASSVTEEIDPNLALA
ncbi:MAG: tRNA N6-adenosine threonylcarbamoyltransferase [Verrucomicrobiota bacterium]